MSFAGSEEPAAYGEVISIGGLGAGVNGKLSSALAEILESKLSIDSSRFYIKFYDVQVILISSLGFSVYVVLKSFGVAPTGVVVYYMYVNKVWANHLNVCSADALVYYNLKRLAPKDLELN